MSGGDQVDDAVFRIPETYPWLPDPSWPTLAPFWDGLSEGELRFPLCGSCGRFQWYPQAACPACRSMAFGWEAVEPDGVVYTFTVVRRPFLAELAPLVPFPVVTVEISAAPGVRLVTVLPDVPGSEIEIGARVRIRAHRVDKSVWLPVADPAAETAVGLAVAATKGDVPHGGDQI